MPTASIMSPATPLIASVSSGSTLTVSLLTWNATVDEIADRAAYDAEAAGYTVLVADTGNGRAALYIKNSATSADWSDPAYITGATLAGLEAAQAAAEAAQAAAEASASAAALSEDNAADSETAAAASASAAATSETNAATSESNASTSASSASTSASAAAASESAASTAQAAAEAAQVITDADVILTGIDADNAAAAASSAAASLAAIEALSDSFGDTYLGSYATEPTLDNDGDPLAAGMIFFDTTANVMKVYTGSSWAAAYVSGSYFLPLSGGTLTGPLVLASDPTALLHPATKQYVDTGLSGKAASSHTHSATDITSGTVPDARLPARLGLYCSTITDWNDATSNGYYKGNNAANAPGSGLVGTTAWLYGHVIAYASTYAIQYVWPASAPITDADTRHAMRIQDNGVWGPWFKVMKSQAEMDSRFAKVAGALLQDFNVNSLVSNSGIIRKPGTAGEITLYGGTGPGDGSYIRTFGGTNATYPHEIWFAANGTIVGKWNNTISQWVLGSSSWPANLVLNSTGIYWGGNLVRHAGNTPDGSIALAQAGTDTTTRAWGADDLKAAAETWGGGSSTLLAILEEQQSSGTAGGDSVVGANTRALNTEVYDAGTYVSLASNVFTVTNDCRAEYSASTFRSNGAICRIYCTTDAAYVANSQSETGHCPSGTASTSLTSRGTCFLEAGKSYRLESQCATARATDGLGRAATLGLTEIYSRVTLWSV